MILGYEEGREAQEQEQAEARAKEVEEVRRRGGGGVLMLCVAGSRTSIDRPSHPCNAGTEHVGFSPTMQILPY